jgi:glycerol-3-phosphate O-acyltransferase
MDLERLNAVLRDAKFDEGTSQILREFFESYDHALQVSGKGDCGGLLEHYIGLIRDEMTNQTIFDHFHMAERVPFDFYEFGRSLVEPLLDTAHSSVGGRQNVEAIIEATDRGENVILLANHQTEIDPQIISLLVTPISDRLASSMIFVAGHRVTTDPVAIPFSRGVNLLCIYSKKYIDIPPEKRSEKLVHNAKTITKLEDLLNEGGHCIYVAPSGGRDRFDATGAVNIAPFDPQSVEMFSLLASKATQPTHLHLLALSTINLLPPPPTTNIELGETRKVSFAPARLAFGPALDMEQIGRDPDRRQRRIERAEILTRTIQEMLRG